MSELTKPKVLWQGEIGGYEYRVTETIGPYRWGVEARAHVEEWEQVGHLECAMVAAHLAKVLAGGETITEYGEGEEIDAPVRVGWLWRLFGRGE